MNEDPKINPLAELRVPIAILGSIAIGTFVKHLETPSPFVLGMFAFLFVNIVLLIIAVHVRFFSAWGQEETRKQDEIAALPKALLNETPNSAYLGWDKDLGIPIRLTDSIRMRHVHVLGATGSGKTESVFFNLLSQDIERGHPAIIMDAKGDESFLKFLRARAPDRLRVFDISNPELCGYCPMKNGTANEAAQRLFNSINWTTEEFYRSRCKTTLYKIVANFRLAHKQNPNLVELSKLLRSPESFAAAMKDPNVEGGMRPRDLLALYEQVHGLKDPIEALTMGAQAKLFNGRDTTRPMIDLTESIQKGEVVYFRLPSLLDAEIVPTLGKLIINDLMFVTSQFHLGCSKVAAKFCPIYIDEFATFVCPQFTDLLSKARSALMALHFAHQSLGDFEELGAGLRSQILDNASTKIIMRSYDADATDYLARTLGTQDDIKVTRRVEIAGENTEMLDAGSQRTVQRFRASPNAMKDLPTGHGFVAIAHGARDSARATIVTELEFPQYKPISSKKENT